AAGTQRVDGIAVPPGAQRDALVAPVEHLVPQRHGAGVGDHGCDGGRIEACTHAGAPVRGRGSAAGRRETSTDSTKFPATPSATVLPIARSTGIDEEASTANTRKVVRLQTITACRVRTCASRESPA